MLTRRTMLVKCVTISSGIFADLLILLICFGSDEGALRGPVRISVTTLEAFVPFWTSLLCWIVRVEDTGWTGQVSVK